MTERRPVVGYEGIYEVSSDGEVFSIIDRKNTWAGRKLKPKLNKDGYLYVGLHKNGVKKTHRVHSMVLKAFKHNPDNLPQANHINGIKTDNRADNLEPSNPSLNALHAYRVLGIVAGFKKEHPKLEGAGKPNRAVRGTNIKTGEIVEMESLSAAARFVDGASSHICHSCQGNRKQAYGWRWEYI
jgi:hypothetical protein